MTGLSDQQQALVVLVSMILVAVGGVSIAVPSQIPSPLNAYIGLTLILIGAIGMALKEYAGIGTNASQSASPPAAKQGRGHIYAVLISLGVIILVLIVTECKYPYYHDAWNMLKIV